MNNSRLAVENVSLANEEVVDRTQWFREREGELVKILTALKDVQDFRAWSSLKELVFDSLVVTLTKEIQSEAKKENPDTLKLNRLAGQLKWAEKYSDLSKLEEIFRLELTNIRKRLHGKEKE